MDLPFEQLLVLVIAAVALVLRLLRRRSPEDGDGVIRSQPPPAPYYPEEEVKAWPPPSRPVEPARPANWPMRTPSAASPPVIAHRPAPATAPPVPASAHPLVAPALVRPRSPWLAPVGRDRNALRRAIVLMAVFGPPRALAPLSDHAAGQGGR